MEFFQGRITLSGNLDYFRHREAWFVYHNLFGYTLEMSRDLIDFLEFFRGHHRESQEVGGHFQGTFDEEQLQTFCQVFLNQGCLVPEGRQEESVARRMVPFFTRWSVVHQPAEGPVRLYIPDPEGHRVEVTTLQGWDAALWRLIDQERTIDDMIEQLRTHPESPRIGLDEKVIAALSAFTHADAQLLKLSPKPFSAYRGGGGGASALPPYLRSNMPYRRVTDEVRGEKSIHVGLDAEAQPLSREQLQRDSVESTIAHLFREPHPALEGRTYGGALAHLYIQEGTLGEGARVLEIGATHPDLALGFLQEVQAHHPALAATLTYTALVPSEEALARVGEALAGFAGASALLGDPERLGSVEGLEAGFHLILSDEFLANLDVTLMRKLTIGPDEEEEEGSGEDGEEGAGEVEAPTNGHAQKQARELYMGGGESVNLVFRYNLKFLDANAEFLLNTGAIRLLDGATRLLAPGGRLALIEFGDLFAYPEPTGDDGAQTSIRFMTLMEVAKHLGFKADFEWVLARLGFDISAQMLATTRRNFLALRQLLADHGVELKNIAYTRHMFEALLPPTLLLSDVHTVEFASLNDRVMGVIPASLKMLEVYRAEEA